MLYLYTGVFSVCLSSMRARFNAKEFWVLETSLDYSCLVWKFEIKTNLRTHNKSDHTSQLIANIDAVILGQLDSRSEIHIQYKPRLLVLIAYLVKVFFFWT